MWEGSLGKISGAIAGYSVLAPNPRRGIHVHGVGIWPAKYPRILGIVLWQHTTLPESMYNSLAVYFRVLWCEFRVEPLNEMILLHVQRVVGFFGDGYTGRWNNCQGFFLKSQAYCVITLCTILS